MAREFIISGVRLIATEHGIVIAANYWGKWKTTFQMIMIIMLLAGIGHPAWHTASTVVTYIALILTVVSLIDYIVKNKGVMKDEG